MGRGKMGKDRKGEKRKKGEDSRGNESKEGKERDSYGPSQDQWKMFTIMRKYSDGSTSDI